jgi:two-component system, sensor histidine kinase and response regulator
VKVLEDIFSDFDMPEDDANGILTFLKGRFSNGRFQIIYRNGSGMFSDGEPLITEDMYRRFLSLPQIGNRTPLSVWPGKDSIYTFPVEALDGMLVFSIPDERDGGSNVRLVPISVELFFSGKALGEKEDLLVTQKKQLHRKLLVLEKKYQEILEENHRGHQILQEQQEGYSQRLKSEIDRQTAELVRANRDLEAKRRFQQKILDTAATAIFSTDRQGRITGANNEFCTITGFTEKDAIGRSTDILNGIPSTAFRSGAATDGQVVKSQCSIRSKDGRELKIIKRADDLVDDAGAVIGTVASFMDVTDLIEAREKAVAASQAKSAFLAAMSHEIRTPMNAVIGFTDMLLDSDLNEPQVDFAKTIKRSAEALLGLIDDILDFSKVEAGQLDLETIDFDPELTAFDVCDLIRSRVAKKPIEILCRIGDSIPAHVKGDPGRFRQVLVNLMGNAAKFTEAGEIELFLDIVSEKDDRIKFHIQVRDTGIGVAKDKLDTIFEVFQQADGSTTRKYGGTGLGLSICRKIAGLMTGKIWAESPAADGNMPIDDRIAPAMEGVGPGSIFHFTSWLQKSGRKDQDRVARASLSGRKVLVVDDNVANLDILAHMFKGVGMRVECLRDGDAVVPALKAAEQIKDPFDVGVVDILLRGMTGLDVVKQVRKQSTQAGHIPMLAFSSSVEKNAKACHDAGFDGFLPKPIRREKMYQMLERLLGLSLKNTDAGPERPAEIHTQYSIRENLKHSVRILLAEDNLLNQKLAMLLLTKAGY